MTRMNHAILVLIRFISSCVINNHTRNMEYFETTGMNPEDYIKEGKPEESFSQLIKRAISSSSRQRLFLTEIYSWILENYPYYKQVDPGWRVSTWDAILSCLLYLDCILCNKNQLISYKFLEFSQAFTFNYKGIC